jgi:hypothetical protein
MLLFDATDISFKWDKPVLRVDGIPVVEGALDGCDFFAHFVTRKFFDRGPQLQRQRLNLQNLGVSTMEITFETRAAVHDVNRADINSPGMSSSWTIHSEPGMTD